MQLLHRQKLLGALALTSNLKFLLFFKTDFPFCPSNRCRLQIVMKWAAWERKLWFFLETLPPWLPHPAAKSPHLLPGCPHEENVSLSNIVTDYEISNDLLAAAAY